MNLRSLWRAAAALVVFSAASVAGVAGPAGAAPAGAAPAVSYRVSVSSDGAVAVEESAPARGTLQPGLSKPLVLPGGDGFGADTVITCHVYGSGPVSNGFIVSFVIGIDCVGGVPRQLFVNQNIARYLPNNGGYIIEPGSDETCVENNSAALFCYSEAPCFQAGATYDGYALIFGVDENGVLHQTEYYAPPRALGCAV
ncbi:hypothetical protein [Catenuloplanes indicus]|uniref:Secreted protein n=1 Tax=Catenuloplanes indicus TaxID=137267 RepID=A0AAE3VUB0_9ACTN|nr:hypothetical protein [Catenuloplanes indicus]MDQ0364333.1 hypothetical protein [Catenuloplanes indicus]